MWVFLNDRFVRKEGRRLRVFLTMDFSGDGVYEPYAPWHTVFMRDQHLARLRRSAESIGLTFPFPTMGGEVAPRGQRRISQDRSPTPISALPSRKRSGSIPAHHPPSTVIAGRRRFIHPSSTALAGTASLLTVAQTRPESHRRVVPAD